MEPGAMVLIPQFLSKKSQSGLCSLAAASREHDCIPSAMRCPSKSLRILHEISEQRGVMGDRHHPEYFSSIGHNLDRKDDFHITEVWLKLVESREFRVGVSLWAKNPALGTFGGQGRPFSHYLRSAMTF
jgi:hypothetical protein